MAVFGLTYTDTQLILLSKGGSFSRAIIALPQGLVRAGRIIDPVKFGQVIRQAMSLAKPHAINAREVTVGMPEEHAFMKSVEMPSQLEEHELRSVLEHQWENFLPIPADQVYYDVLALTPQKGKKTSTQQVLVVAYPREAINSLLNSLEHAELTPKKVVPLSFGFAHLYARTATTAPTLILQSLNGQDVIAAVVQNRLTHFSTTIHATVGDPKCLRQIDNIRQYYEKNIGEATTKIGSILILPTPDAQTLAQQVQSFAIPTTIATVGHGLKNASLDDPLPFLPLVGLLAQTPLLSTVPATIGTDREALRQKRVVRSFLAVATLIFIFTTYLSLVFLGALQVNKRSRITYSQALVARVTQDEAPLQKRITAFNTQVAAVKEALAKSLPVSQPYAAVIKAQTSQPGITIVLISSESEKQAYRVTGKANNAQAFTSFLATLKAAPEFAQATFANDELATDNNFNFTISRASP